MRWSAALLFIGASLNLFAQDDLFELRQITVHLQDKLSRDLLVDANTAWLGVRLLEDQESPLKPGTQVGTVERSYLPGDTTYQKFGISDGTARPQFAVYKDESKVLNYEVVALVREPGAASDRVIRLDKGVWAVSKISPASVSARTPDYRAPMQTWEWFLFLGFLAAGCVLLYFAFVRGIFSRMLFKRRMKVESAEAWSNVLTVFMLLALMATMYVLLAGPPMLADNYVRSCFYVMAMFLGATAVVTVLGVALTAKR